jgi:GcrA cell cycle regulator
MSRWTPEAEAMLRRRWREGATASEIAAELPELPAGKTRPAQRPTRDMVIGKARRLGLKARPSPIRQKEPAE